MAAPNVGPPERQGFWPRLGRTGPYTTLRWSNPMSSRSNRAPSADPRGMVGDGGRRSVQRRPSDLKRVSAVTPASNARPRPSSRIPKPRLAGGPATGVRHAARRVRGLVGGKPERSQAGAAAEPCRRAAAPRAECRGRMPGMDGPGARALLARYAAAALAFLGRLRPETGQAMAGR